MNNLKMLVPIDHSPNAARTIKTLISLKDKISGSVTLLHVFGVDQIKYHGVPETHYEMVEKYAQQTIQDYIEKQKKIFLDEGIQTETLVVKGSPRKIICQLADSGNYDLLVIGRHTEGEVRNLLFGNVSNYVIHNCKCQLLVL